VSVSRLSHTFNKVSKPSSEEWANLVDLMNPINAFKKYRAALSEKEGLCIPYIGVILQNITMIEEGNTDKLPTEPNSINFPKYTMLYKTISSFLYCSYSICSIERTDPIYLYCQDLPSLEEEELYELSKTRQPRQKD